ncbi:MAG: V-type ATP synthase subunit D [Clostridiales bacterium]|nr:V-type ATP synthase subunit D [Clostridiales bacterium]
MARLNVNPTRMELRRLKTRLKTAVRGHKLLKDKSDEMIRQFMSFVKQNKALREEIEGDLREALKYFMLAGSVMGEENIEQTFAMPSRTLAVRAGLKNVMGIDVPMLEIAGTEGELPYVLSSVPADMDTAVIKLTELSEKLLRLAEVEKTCNMLAQEIEKNRRRVNALEYVMIPQLNETIKYIMMKLDENERATIIRLMKVKSLLEKQDNA